jgi:hypothetical protein
MKNGWITIRRRLFALGMIIIAGLSPLASLAAAQVREQGRDEFHQSYALAPDGIVSISNTSGNIRVTSWNESRVQVDAIKHARRAEDLALVEIQVNARPERVEIQTVYLPRRLSTVSVDYDVKVPRSAVLNTLTTRSGDIIVQGAVARVVASSRSGNVTVQNVAGDATLGSSSGNVTVDRVGGTLVISASSGNLQINDVGGQLNASSSSGNVQATQIKGDATANSSSGSVRLERVGGRAFARSFGSWVTVRDVSGDAQASSSSDAVTVESVRGRAIVTSLSGRVIVRDVQEGVSAKSVSSSVEISNVKGRVEAGSTSDAVILREIDSRDVRAGSNSSNVRFQGKIYDDGRYEFSSFSGNVVLVMPVVNGFNLTASTRNGSIETDFAIQNRFGISTGRQSRIEGIHGKGGAQIIAVSYSGNIYLKKQ